MQLIKMEANQDKSATSFCQQVAAWMQDMLRNFYLVKNHIIDNISTTKRKPLSFGIPIIKKKMFQFSLNLKTANFFSLKIATNFC
jgi:hypothetical protein